MDPRTIRDLANDDLRTKIGDLERSKSPNSYSCPCGNSVLHCSYPQCGILYGQIGPAVTLASRGAEPFIRSHANGCPEFEPTIGPRWGGLGKYLQAPSRLAGRRMSAGDDR